jgi:hypothetical protein
MSKKGRKHCAHAGEPVLNWQPIAGGRRQIRSHYSLCGCYIKFVRQTPSNIAKADAGGAKELEPCK